MPKDRHSANTNYYTVMPEGENLGGTSSNKWE